MKICFFSAKYIPTVGGVERYTNNLARRLAKAGHEIVIVTSELEGLPLRERSAEGIEIFRLPVFHFMNDRFPFLKPGSKHRELSKELWSFGFDAVVINNHFYSSCVWAAIESRKRKIPAILIEHATQYLMTGALPLRLAGRLYEHICAAIIKKRVASACGVSKACGVWLKVFGIASAGEIYNAVDPDELEALSLNGKRDLRAALGIGAEAPLIAFSGRLIPEKGVLQLARALKAIRVAHGDAVLVMAGDGALRNELEKLDAEGLYLLGQTSYEDSLALIRQADLFCLPTRSEGFSGAVLEAAALETPIITTPTGGSPEIIKNEDCGILIPDMSEESIATACIRALGDAEWRHRAAQNAKETLLNNFTWEKSCKALLSALEVL